MDFVNYRCVRTDVQIFLPQPKPQPKTPLLSNLAVLVLLSAHRTPQSQPPANARCRLRRRSSMLPRFPPVSEKPVGVEVRHVRRMIEDVEIDDRTRDVRQSFRLVRAREGGGLKPSVKNVLDRFGFPNLTETALPARRVSAPAGLIVTSRTSAAVVAMQVNLRRSRSAPFLIVLLPRALMIGVSAPREEQERPPHSAAAACACR